MSRLLTTVKLRRNWTRLMMMDDATKARIHEVAAGALRPLAIANATALATMFLAWSQQALLFHDLAKPMLILELGFLLATLGIALVIVASMFPEGKFHAPLSLSLIAFLSFITLVYALSRASSDIAKDTILYQDSTSRRGEACQRFFGAASSEWVQEHTIARIEELMREPNLKISQRQALQKDLDHLENGYSPEELERTPVVRSKEKCQP